MSQGILTALLISSPNEPGLPNHKESIQSLRMTAIALDNTREANKTSLDSVHMSHSRNNWKGDGRQGEAVSGCLFPKTEKAVYFSICFRFFCLFGDQLYPVFMIDPVCCWRNTVTTLRPGAQAQTNTFFKRCRLKPRP